MTNHLGAITSGADAIHPGMGFVRECGLCRSVRQANVIFVGPPASAIGYGVESGSQGSDAVGRRAASAGSTAPRRIDRLREVASSMGYPVLLKAAAGGGGKMREVRSDAEFEEAFASAQREARATGDDLMLVERLLEPRRRGSSVL